MEQIHFKTKTKFREWLGENHDTCNGIWMLFFKKHTNIQTISLDDAIDEALCFGWIDSLVKSIDKERYVRKFTPRTNPKKWSDSNKIRVIRLLQSKRMTEYGLKKIEIYNRTGTVDWSLDDIKMFKQKVIELPPDLFEKLQLHEPALTNFSRLAHGYQAQFIGWISQAKRSATRQKRLGEVIELLKNNKKLGLK